MSNRTASLDEKPLTRFDARLLAVPATLTVVRLVE
jgi:hypothetical protein